MGAQGRRGGRPARPQSGGARSETRSHGTGGTRGQQIRREHGDDETIEAGRYRPRRERNFELPRPVVEELRDVAGNRTAAGLERRLMNAAQSYERDRYPEALQLLKPVVEAAPSSGAARELYGLTLYRLGRWRQAAKELRYFHELTSSYDQHPVIADCERALGHLDRVEQLWDDLRQAGVDREVLVEGRLVMSGALADAGRIEEAIKLLGPAGKQRRHPDLSVVREWYALADIYERAGDLPRARELFARVAQHAPGMLDAPDRLRAIR